MNIINDGVLAFGSFIATILAPDGTTSRGDFIFENFNDSRETQQHESMSEVGAPRAEKHIFQNPSGTATLQYPTTAEIGVLRGDRFMQQIPGSTALTITGVAATNVITTSAAHGLAVGDRIYISSVTGGTGLAVGGYFVLTVPSSTTLTLSSTSGGSVLDFTTDITAGGLYAIDDQKIISVSRTFSHNGEKKVNIGFRKILNPGAYSVA